MTKHLPFNEFDITGIQLAVERYNSAGLKATCDVGGRQSGVVGIEFKNPNTRDSSLVSFEIHKVARPGWFGDRAWWVIQLWSASTSDAPFDKRGCVSGRTLAYTISEAELDLSCNFISVCDFELAAQ